MSSLNYEIVAPGVIEMEIPKPPMTGLNLN
jgi:hypothetical protein